MTRPTVIIQGLSPFKTRPPPPWRRVGRPRETGPFPTSIEAAAHLPKECVEAEAQCSYKKGDPAVAGPRASDSEPLTAVTSWL